MELGIRLSQQLLSFAWSILFGILLGALYGIFQLFRRFVKGNVIATAAEDVIFWILAAFFFYTFFVIFTEGRVRFYALCGGTIGFVLYLKTLGRLLCFLCEKTLRWIFYPIKRLFRLLKRFFHEKYKNISGNPLQNCK